MVPCRPFPTRAVRRAPGGRPLLPPVAAGALLAILLLAACGPGPADHPPGGGSADRDGAAVVAPPAVTVGGEHSTDVPAAAVPQPSEPPRPRSRQELVDSGGAAPFERYLAGPWSRDTGSGGDESGRAPVDIIHFEPEQRHITFFDGEVQEIYSWNTSDLRTAARLAIRMHNALVTSVEKTVVVEVVADDELHLTVRSSASGGDSDQNGTYRRLGAAARAELVRTAAPLPGLAALQLEGLYRGSDGQTIDFDAPRFTWQQHDRRWSGGFAVYSAGRPVIVFKTVSAAGTTSDIRTYAVEFREQRGPRTGAALAHAAPGDAGNLRTRRRCNRRPAL